MKKQQKKNRYVDLTIDTIRVLGCEMVTLAQSGHTGVVLSAAPILFSLYRDHLLADVNNTYFLNRDRLVLSCGHASALLYAIMHLAGYKISINDLKNFRKINAKTAGHPENCLTAGVDATTGPLGQGVGIAVGMAIAQTRLAAYFKKFHLFNYYTYCVLGDGCIQEGVSYEAFSIAAKLKLNKLIFLYDSNGVQLENKVTDNTITDFAKYFEALGFNYMQVNDGNDYEAITQAIGVAKTCLDKPTMIEIKTKIGFGSVFEGSFQAHSGIFNEEQLQKLKINLGYFNEKFEISKNAYNEFISFQKRGQKAAIIFDEKVKKMKLNDPKKYHIFENLIHHRIDFDKKWFLTYEKKEDATRNIAHYVINQICKNNPLIMLLSPDLSISTKARFDAGATYSADNRLGVNVDLGVREFAMVCILTGLALSHIKAIGSTFLAFSDYCKAALRLAALSQAPIINVFSHDSFAVGEDGPTHQPVEQLWALRLIPNHLVFRIANLDEAIKGFEFAFNNSKTPVSIITCRQNVALFKATNLKISRGAYLVKKEMVNDINIIATGSEVSLALEVKALLQTKYQINANVISMVCFELFYKQPEIVQKMIINAKPVFSIEFGTTLPWSGITNFSFGLNSYGASGSFGDLMKKFKLTSENIAAQIAKIMQK